MLMRRWGRARQGDGQLVILVGEPGLGKSRLIEEFHPRLREVPHTWVEWSCSQLLQNTPLHPIAEWGRQRFRGADIPAEQRLADLENTLALVKLDPAENAPLLAPLLDILLPQDRGATLEPEVLRRRLLTALTNWVMAGARTQPAVLALEDLHWADPTTLELLRRRRCVSAMSIAARHSAHWTSRYCPEKWSGVCAGPAPISGDPGRRILGATSALATEGDMTVDPTGDTTMTQGKMRSPAKENAISPNCYAIRAAGQTLKCRCRR